MNFALIWNKRNLSHTHLASAIIIYLSLFNCINQNLNVQDVAQGYESAGACGMSVLTDMKYFGGSLEDLLTARASCNMPLLRKEFIIDPYQIVEAKAFGADVILLIAAILSREEIQTFSTLVQSLGM